MKIVRSIVIYALLALYLLVVGRDFVQNPGLLVIPGTLALCFLLLGGGPRLLGCVLPGYCFNIFISLSIALVLTAGTGYLCWLLTRDALEVYFQILIVPLCLLMLFLSTVILRVTLEQRLAKAALSVKAA